MIGTADGVRVPGTWRHAIICNGGSDFLTDLSFAPAVKIYHSYPQRALEDPGKQALRNKVLTKETEAPAVPEDAHGGLRDDGYRAGMAITGKRRVLYRQGSGFWRMTAKWVLAFGALYLLDGGLLRSWGDALVWPMIGILLWAPFGIGVVWYPKKDQRVELTARELRVRRKRLPMEKVNLLHVARLWLEGRSTADGEPVPAWARTDRVVWVPLRDGRAFGVEFRDPAAFAKVFGAFAVAACGGPDIVRARAAAETYPDPLPMRPRPAEDAGSWLDLLDVLD